MSSSLFSVKVLYLFNLVHFVFTISDESYTILKLMTSYLIFSNLNLKHPNYSVRFASDHYRKLYSSKVNLTSRDRPKSAPYPRLKNSKKTSKCQVFSFTVLENRKFYEKKIFEKITYSKNGSSGAPGPASTSPCRAERGTLPKLSTFLSQLKWFCRKTSKN